MTPENMFFLNTIKSVLTLIGPRCSVQQDPHGTWRSAESIETLTTVITKAEESGVAPETRGLLCLFAAHALVNGTYENAIRDLQTRAAAVSR